MGIINTLTGSNSAIDNNQAAQDFQRLLAPGEKIMSAYKLMRDTILFTNGRMIFVDVKGMTGSEVDYISFPYRSIVKFAVESKGAFDLNATLKIWVAGDDKPMEEKFGTDSDVYQIQALIAANVIAAR